MHKVEQAFFEATEISVSCRDRIAILIKNAKPNNTVLINNVVEFTWSIGSQNNPKPLVYSVNVKFLTNSQLTYLQSVVLKPAS